MAKEKVYKLAQEFKVSSEALVQMLREMGITVKSHMSTVDDNLRDEIKRKFEQARAEIKKEYDRKKLLIAKKKEEMAAKLEKKPEPTLTPPPRQEQAPLRAEDIFKPTVTMPRTAQPAAGPALREYRPAADARPAPRTQPAAGAGPGAPAPAPSSAPAQGGGRPDGFNRKKQKKKGGRRRDERPGIDETELKSTIKKTLARIGAGTARKKYRKDTTRPDEEGAPEKKLLRVSEFVTAAELANMIGQSPSEVLTKCLELGLFVTINQRLDFETIELLADEFGYSAQLMEEYSTSEEDVVDGETGELMPRAPVVTIMGHVDHGKTSLLDYIRRTNVIAGEAGGITQHIAAYEVLTANGSVTFLDTPGHEAFTAMRARGSMITDVIVLVVAADSGVMPQTREAIDHARAANVPLVVAVNKIDLPTANPDRVKTELAQYNVVVEEYGGKAQCVEISAKTGKNVDRLLEILALETELLELKADPLGPARGVVVEAELDKGRGPIATVLVQRGCLRKGDAFVTGMHNGRVRDLFNERGQIVEMALPSQPVLVLGLSGTPQAGDSFKVVADEKDAREISARRRLAQREREMRRIGSVSLDHLYEQIQAGNIKNLNLIIKGDVDGSVEALADSLIKLSNDEVRVNVIRKGVGAVKEADIMLAAASNALIIGFHLNPNSKIREMAKREGVEIRTYRIIYEAVDAMHKALEGLLPPEIKENILASVEVRQVFKISRVGAIAGCMVSSGTVTRGAKARLIRDDIEIVDSTISSLRRIKDDVREVQAGYECGINLDKFSDYREGDRIEVYEEIKVARKLA